MVQTCSKRSDWFCILCACYVYIKNRIRFSDIIKNRFEKAYGSLPDFLDEIFTPIIVCRTCHNDLQRNLNQNRPLRYLKPAIWASPKPDHSNCYMCLFTVHKYNRIAKSQFGYAIDSTNLTPPIANSNYNDKLNNLQNLVKNTDEDAVKNLLKDLVDCVLTNKTYLVKNSDQIKKQLSANKKLFKNGLDQTNLNKLDYFNRLNLSNEKIGQINEIFQSNKRPLEEDDEISIVKEIKRTSVDQLIYKSKDPFFNKNPETEIRAKVKDLTKKELIMHHDIEIKNGAVYQVENDQSMSQKNLFDLSSGACEGTFRVCDGIELRTYFGKKYKPNRDIQKTSRSEFEDLVSMMEIDDRGRNILERFFERKNYFVWF